MLLSFLLRYNAFFFKASYYTVRQRKNKKKAENIIIIIIITNKKKKQYQGVNSIVKSEKSLFGVLVVYVIIV